MSRPFALMLCFVMSSPSLAADPAKDCDTLSGEPAIKACDLAIRNNPRDSASYNSRGYEYLQMGNYERALADYSKAIEINPKYALALTNRGVIYFNKGDFDRSIADYTRAIAIDPAPATTTTDGPVRTNINVYNNRGGAYFRKGDLARAEADFTRAAQMSPKHPQPHANLGKLHVARGNYMAALDEYNKALDLKADYAWGLGGRAWVLLKMGRAQQALPDVDLALRLERSVVYLNVRGHVLEALGRRTEAIDDLRQVLASQRAEPDIKEAQELARQALRRLDAAH